MATKKRHHYIPRFYLKRFSINNEGKFIGLYNHKNNVFVEAAPLRHQAYANFLYGEDDEIENALAEMENIVARMFHYWTEEKLFHLPFPDSAAFKLLKRFILYQAFRTPKAGSQLMTTVNEGMKIILKEIKPDLWKELESGVLVHKNPVLLSLTNSIEHEDLLNFLDCKFIVNLSELPIISSDNPVIFYNHLMESAGNYIGATGLVAKGLQIFYPIHPRLIICLYDPKIYSLVDAKVDCCSTESIEDIHQLNALQFINSDSQLFFDDLVSEEYILHLCKEYNGYKNFPTHVNSLIKEGSRKLFFTGSNDPHINLNLSFFKLLVNASDYKNNFVPLRSPLFERPVRKNIHFDL